VSDWPVTDPICQSRDMRGTMQPHSLPGWLATCSPVIAQQSVALFTSLHNLCIITIVS
jgi:hypothetical protein